MQAQLQDGDAVPKMGRSEGIPTGPASRVSPDRRTTLSHGYEKIMSPAMASVRGARRAVLPSDKEAGATLNAGLFRSPPGGGRPSAARHSPCALAKFPIFLMRDDGQNEPLADTANRATGDVFVLERNIVNAAQSCATGGPRNGSRGIEGCNRAQEQSLVARKCTRIAANESVARPFRRIASKSGTNGEENLAVKLYARFEAVPGQKWDRRAAFTECYAVLEKIMDSTPGKGDGS